MRGGPIFTKSPNGNAVVARSRGSRPRPPPARRECELPPDHALGAGGDPRSVGEPPGAPEAAPILEPDGAEPVVEGAARQPAGHPSAPPRQREIQRLERDGIRCEAALAVP